MTLASVGVLVDDGGDSCGIVIVKVCVEWRFLDVSPGSRVYGSSAISGVDDDYIRGIAEDGAWKKVNRQNHERTSGTNHIVDGTYTGQDVYLSSMHDTRCTTQ